MANSKVFEWSIAIADNKSIQILGPQKHESKSIQLHDILAVNPLVVRVRSFLKKAWDLGVDDPRKGIHGLKVALAMTLISFFYYIKPLNGAFNGGDGNNAVWAVMTVVVVFEYTAGATLCKGLNRIGATLIAGFLALAVCLVAMETGRHKIVAVLKPVIMGVSLFVISAVATYLRFIPYMKARHDYGCMIFILTYGLVLVSGYDEKIQNQKQLIYVTNVRISTIIFGSVLCIIVSVFVCPVWAGMDLHNLISSNLNKLANSLESCVYEYFGHGDEESRKQLEDYKSVLNSKASEESMSNHARWEPAHGKFSFRHPWKMYVKIGASSRSCAYSVETLISRLDSKTQVPETIKNHVKTSCLTLSSSSSDVLRILSTTVSTMTIPTEMDKAIKEMKNGVRQLQNDVESLPDLLIQTHTKHELLEVIPLVTFIYLLIEIASRIRDIIIVVEEFAEMAKFKLAEDE
ncbi:aluminum-activated malate transporter 10-like [Rutidosis leptorrhynchoides]|uniref:aluminum-activated malate transporter 10-like n=1 Tax=Rutidosis leptorrhynchoides TaxID=125765 RepID=UPI003A991F7E